MSRPGRSGGTWPGWPALAGPGGRLRLRRRRAGRGGGRGGHPLAGGHAAGRRSRLVAAAASPGPDRDHAGRSPGSRRSPRGRRCSATPWPPRPAWSRPSLATAPVAPEPIRDAGHRPGRPAAARRTPRRPRCGRSPPSWPTPPATWSSPRCCSPPQQQASDLGRAAGQPGRDRPRARGACGCGSTPGGPGSAPRCGSSSPPRWRWCWACWSSAARSCRRMTPRPGSWCSLAVGGLFAAAFWLLRKIARFGEPPAFPHPARRPRPPARGAVVTAALLLGAGFGLGLAGHRVRARARPAAAGRGARRPHPATQPAPALPAEEGGWAARAGRPVRRRPGRPGPAQRPGPVRPGRARPPARPAARRAGHRRDHRAAAPPGHDRRPRAGRGGPGLAAARRRLGDPGRRRVPAARPGRARRGRRGAGTTSATPCRRSWTWW